MQSFPKRVLGVLQSAVIIGLSVAVTSAAIGGSVYATGRMFDYIRGAKAGSSLKGAANFVSKNPELVCLGVGAAIANSSDRARNSR